ncbi:ionotropic receptor 25a-like [Hylaeus anthracinus]|uniref:ionotropic receptor 25a-like n=1 Tax=Hylaeus anthracinus TaxID=313031 RepID=UPI0023B9A928|nr:ionotropic receptor 25a-like [Hylaeus anthracinus]
MSSGMGTVYRAVTGIAPPYVMYNTTTGSFYGYCIDLLNDIGSLAGFDYTIREAYDEHYGHRDPRNGRWNGMVDELIKNISDIAVGPIWITSDRAQVVDFTVPYQGPSGFAIMMLKRKRQIPFLRFLMILEIEVWLSFAFAFFLTILLLFILEKYSPFSYRNNRQKYRNEPDDRFSSLKECLWFAFASLTPQGGGDIPKNLSGKLAAAIWWLFSFVIVAAYTANLAADETLERLERSIDSMDDLTKQYRVRYSTLANSSTFRYFHGMKEAEDMLYQMWRQMTLDENTPEWNRSKYAVWDYPLEDKFTKMYYAMDEVGFVPSVEQAVKMVRNVNRTYEFAFIAEAMTIKYLMLTSCDFRQVGYEFSKKPFAFAVRKDSPLKKKIDDAIAYLAMKRKLNDLEKKWWDENPIRANCPADKDFNAGFGLDDLAAVFLLILVGVLLAILTLCLEYLWHFYGPRQNKKVRLFARMLSTHEKSKMEGKSRK